MSNFTSCDSCGHAVRVPVREKKVEVWNTADAFWLRIWKMVIVGVILFTAIIVAGISYNSRIKMEEMETLLSDPSVKIEIQEIPANGDIRKFTRGE